MQSIGDMAQALVLRHHQTQLREQVGRLGIELSTGVIEDKAKLLGGDLTVLATMDRSLKALEGFRIATAESGFVADVMQTALGRIQERSAELGPRLLQVELQQSGSLQASMARDAASVFKATLSDLNTAAAGRSVFGGVATDRAAVNDGATMLDALRGELIGASALSDIEARLDLWFDSPGGGFETDGYTGSTTGVAATRLSASDSAHLDVRADDPVFRNTLKALSLAALSHDSALELPQDLRKDMLASAGAMLLNIQTPLTELRAEVGSLQARIEETETRNAAEHTATELARLRLVGADQYETAVRLQDAQVQLEALYSVTARAARLSFAEFMR